MMQTNKNYDVIIVGAGPAGLFAAYKLKEEAPDASILLLDQGEEEGKRECPALEGMPCTHCNFCHITGGFGGAGLFSDGKLCLDLNVGGHEDALGIDSISGEKLVEEVEKVLEDFDGESEKKIPDGLSCSILGAKALKLGLRLNCYPVRHFASGRLFSILKRLREEGLNGIDLQVKTKLQAVTFDPSSYFEIRARVQVYTGEIGTYFTHKLVLAVGKVGSRWVANMLSQLGAQVTPNQCYIGYRIETKHEFLAPLFELAYNPKFERKLHDGIKIKTHCFCRNGRVLITLYDGYPLAGGDTPRPEEGINANFAVLVQEPHPGAIPWTQIEAYLRHVRKIGEGNLLVQRFVDFRKNLATSTEALKKNPIVPSALHVSKSFNLRKLNTPYNFDVKLIDFLSRLNALFPGIDSDDTLLYAPAIEWWMPKVKIKPGTMETSLQGIYAVGDGAGLSQGIVFAAATGLLSALSIAESLRKKAGIKNLKQQSISEAFTEFLS